MQKVEGGYLVGTGTAAQRRRRAAALDRLKFALEKEERVGDGCPSRTRRIERMQREIREIERKPCK